MTVLWANKSVLRESEASAATALRLVTQAFSQDVKFLA